MSSLILVITIIAAFTVVIGSFPNLASSAVSLSGDTTVGSQVLIGN